MFNRALKLNFDLLKGQTKVFMTCKLQSIHAVYWPFFFYRAAVTELDGFQRDDMHLLRLLGIVDFEIPRALKRYRNYHKFRVSRMSFFYQEPFEQYDALLRSNMCCLLENRDKHGRYVFYLDSSKMDTTKYEMDDLCVLENLWLEAIMDKPDVVKRGVACIMDAKE